MMTIMIILLSLSLIMMIKLYNPVKTSFSLVIMSMGVFFHFFILNSSSWFSLIFFMLFIGGIMIMFMVLSSLLPNEKSFKSKNMIFFSLLFVLWNYTYLNFSLSSEIYNTYQMKMLFHNSWNFEVFMMLILLYFLSFVYIVSKGASSLRTVSN